MTPFRNAELAYDPFSEAFTLNWLMTPFPKPPFRKPGANPMLAMLFARASTLKYNPTMDFAFPGADESANSALMRGLAATSFGYTFAYFPGGAVGTPGATDHINPIPTPEMVSELFPMIDQAKAEAGMNMLIGQLPFVDAFIDEFAFTAAELGVV
jgi:hypothetical protein